MRNKKFLIICCTLIFISTICFIITIFINRDGYSEVHIDNIQNNTFTHTIKDDNGESTEEILFLAETGTRKIIIKSNDDNIDDINATSEFNYSIKDNTIYIHYANLTYSYKMKKNCIYDTNNTDIKYCIKKDA